MFGICKHETTEERLLACNAMYTWHVQIWTYHGLWRHKWLAFYFGHCFSMKCHFKSRQYVPAPWNKLTDDNVFMLSVTARLSCYPKSRHNVGCEWRSITWTDIHSSHRMNFLVLGDSLNFHIRPHSVLIKLEVKFYVQIFLSSRNSLLNGHADDAKLYLLNICISAFWWA